MILLPAADIDSLTQERFARFYATTKQSLEAMARGDSKIQGVSAAECAAFRILAAYKWCEEDSEDPFRALSLADSFVAAHDFPKAISTLTAIHEFSADYFLSYFDSPDFKIAILCLAQGRHEDALRWLQHRLEQGKDDEGGPLKFYLGRAKHGAARWDEAKHNYLEAMSICAAYEVADDADIIRQLFTRIADGLALAVCKKPPPPVSWEDYSLGLVGGDWDTPLSAV